jgi:hypothetical protein
MSAFIRRHRYVLLLVLSLMLLSCGMVSLLMYGRQQTLTCQRRADAPVTCTRQISWFKLFPLEAARTISLPHLAKAEISCRTNGETAAYECHSDDVQLVTLTETVSISGFLDETTAHETVDRLNEFFDSTEQQLVIESQNQTVAILGLVFVAVPYLILGIWLLAVIIRPATVRRT